MEELAERRARLSALYLSAPRDVYFEAVRTAIKDYYLADPSNPYQQSGRSSGAQRWAETRQCIVQAIHRDGDLLDVGCANGLLLECLVGWAAERGLTIRPHGIDFVPELVELARERLARHAGTFELANAFYWTPAGSSISSVQISTMFNLRTGRSSSPASIVPSATADD